MRAVIAATATSVLSSARVQRRHVGIRARHVGWIVGGLAVAAAVAACHRQRRVRRRATMQHGQLRRGLILVLACLRLWTPQIGTGAHIDLFV